MDGVIYHGRRLLDGALEFVEWLQRERKKYLFLTNNSAYSPRQLRDRFAQMGLSVAEDHFMTSALATASFLRSQKPNARVFMIGDTGLAEALEEAGLVLTEEEPDYVIVGETRQYRYALIEKAIRFVVSGARLIGTNPDLTGPGEDGIVPACRALIAPIEMASGRQAYYIGKPNPLIMRESLRRLGARREETMIIGDRMDTDIVAGIESEIETVLVLSGITAREDLPRFPYRPHHVLHHVGHICMKCAKIATEIA